jgi:hypothetical protein
MGELQNVIQTRFVKACFWKVAVIVYCQRYLAPVEEWPIPKGDCEERDVINMALIMVPLMWHVSAIPWKAAYDPQVKEFVCPKRENQIRWNF